MRGGLRRSVAALFVATAFVMAACSSGGDAAGGPTVTVDCATFESEGAGGVSLTREVSAGIGETVLVRLCSNPSTGFSWEDPTWEGDASLDGLTRSAAAADAPLPGAAGTESFTFEATGAGSAIVHFVYSQPWAGGIKGAWRLDLTVNVG